MESNKFNVEYFSKEVDKYTKRLTNFIKKQPKKNLLEIRSRKKLVPPPNNSFQVADARVPVRYTQLERMANNLKNTNLESEKKQRDRLYLANKQNRDALQIVLKKSLAERARKRKIGEAYTKFMKKTVNNNFMKNKKDSKNEKIIAYKKKFLNMTKKINDQLYSRLVSRSDKIQKVVLSKNNSDPITHTPFKNDEIILSTGKPGQYFSLNSFEKLLKRQKTREYISNNTGVRTVGEIKSLAKNNKSKNVIVYKKNPLNRQQIQAKNVKFVRVVINKK
jgi:hypothetical protein